MKSTYLFAGDLRESPGDDRVREKLVQDIRIVNVLGFLTHSENGDPLRQMGFSEQTVSGFISREGLAVVRIT